MSAADPNQQTFMLGVGAVLLLAAAALFISIRKRRQKRSIDFNTATQTQIE
jgi:LPXTG-motif cell wall-anchored protein